VSCYHFEIYQKVDFAVCGGIEPPQITKAQGI
jgi:hypothetical protein